MELYVLILFTIFALLIAPLYFHWRRKMTISIAKELPISYFTKMRIIRFTICVFTSLMAIFITSVLLIYGIKARGYLFFNERELIYLVIIAIIWLGVTFGAGLYISGVFIEQYSMRNIKENPEYSRLKIATKLLHGRISHVFIYTGGMAILLMISLIEVINPSKNTDVVQWLMYAIIGIVFGVIYYQAQIKNLTWRSQFPFFTYLFSQGLVIYAFIGEPLKYPFFTFYLFYSGICFISLLIKYFFYN